MKPKNPIFDDQSQGWVSTDQCSNKRCCTCSECQNEKANRKNTNFSISGSANSAPSNDARKEFDEDIARFMKCLNDAIPGCTYEAHLVIQNKEGEACNGK